MIRQDETSSIPISLIEVGRRHEQPSEIEIDRMVNSIKEQGLLRPGSPRSRNWAGPKFIAVVLDGTPQEFETAELVEKLERRHFDKQQRDKELVELRAKGSARRSAEGIKRQAVV